MPPCNQDLEFWRSPNRFHLRLYLNYFPLSHCLVWVLSLMVGSAMNVRPWRALQYRKVLLQVHVMQRNEYTCQIGLTLLRQASSSAQSQTAANAANCCCNGRSCPVTSSSHGRPTFTLHFFFPPSNAPHWTVCHIYRGCQWMFTSHALSVDLCRLKASKALLLVMVFSDSEIIWKCLVWICHEASSAKRWDPSDSHKFWNGQIWEHDCWQNFCVGRRDFMQQPLLKGVPWTHDTVVV